MPGPDIGHRSRWTARRVRASGSSVLLAIAAIVAVVLVRDLYVAAVQPVGWAVAAAAVALVLSPLVRLLDRWVPRGVAIVATLLIGLAGVAGVGAFLVMEVQDQLGELSERLPAAAADLEERSGEDGVFARLELESLVQDLVDRTTERVAPKPTIEDAVGTVPAFFVSGVLVIFFLVWGGSLLAGLQRQISDAERRDQLTRMALLASHLAQQYVVAALALGIIAAVAGGSLAWAIDLPAPLTIGVVIGVSSVIPYVGVLFGSVPFLLLTGASHPLTTTVGVAIALVALQAAVTFITRRLIEARTLRVGPAAIVVAALVGSDLYGIGGSLVAVLAGILAVAGIEAWRREHEEPDPGGSPGDPERSPGDPPGASPQVAWRR